MTTTTLPLSGPELQAQLTDLDGIIARREGDLGEAIVDGALAQAKSDARGVKTAQVSAAKIESELAPLRARRQSLRAMSNGMIRAWQATIKAQRAEQFDAAMLLVDGAREDMQAADDGLRQAVENLIDVTLVWQRVRNETDHLWARLSSAGGQLKRPSPTPPARSYADLPMWRSVVLKDVLTALRGVPGKSSPLARLPAILSSRDKE